MTLLPNGDAKHHQPVIYSFWQGVQISGNAALNCKANSIQPILTTVFPYPIEGVTFILELVLKSKSGFA